MEKPIKQQIEEIQNLVKDKSVSLVRVIAKIQLLNADLMEDDAVVSEEDLDILDADGRRMAAMGYCMSAMFLAKEYRGE